MGSIVGGPTALSHLASSVDAGMCWRADRADSKGRERGESWEGWAGENESQVPTASYPAISPGLPRSCPFLPSSGAFASLPPSQSREERLAGVGQARVASARGVKVSTAGAA
jgi:hypothetical protein